MKRIHFIEIGDEPWCPRGIRRGVTDFCRFVTQHSGLYNAVAPLLADALRTTGATRIIDMGSGAGGPWLSLLPALREYGVDLPVSLTDHDPNIEAFEWARKSSGGGLSYYPEPVDATSVPAEMAGFRTMFQAFHHLRPEQAHAALADAAAKGQGVAIFDGTRPGWWLWPLILFMPIRVLLATPFIRPFRWSRLFWTYLVPALPLVLTFDVIVSLLRVYSVEELREITAGLNNHHWEIGIVRARPLPLRITYLIGTPMEKVV